MIEAAYSPQRKNATSPRNYHKGRPHKYYTLCGAFLQGGCENHMKGRDSMKTIIDQLYSGEIYPAEQILPTSPKYRPTSLKIGQEREELKKKLCKEDADRLEELNGLYLDICSMNCYAGFAYGLKLGAMLLTEIMDEKEEIGL